MQRAVHRVAFVIAPLIAAASALAQDHGAPGAHGAAEAAGHGGVEPAGVIPTIEQGIIPMLVSIGVFAAVFAVLALKVWPQINKGLKDRENKIRSEIQAAEQAQQEARAALAQYERNLAQARAEAQKMLDDAKAQQTEMSAQMRSRNETELNGMREKAKRDIEQAKRAAVAEIHEHATELAMSIASKVLQREIGPQDQQRLVRESLAQMPGAGRN